MNSEGLNSSVTSRIGIVNSQGSVEVGTFVSK